MVGSRWTRRDLDGHVHYTPREWTGGVDLEEEYNIVTRLPTSARRQGLRFESERSLIRSIPED